MTRNSWFPTQTEGSIYVVYHWSKPASISQFGFILREKHKGYHDRLSYSTCHGEKKHLKKIEEKKIHLYHRDKNARNSYIFTFKF